MFDRLVANSKFDFELDLQQRKGSFFFQIQVQFLYYAEFTCVPWYFIPSVFH